jgi:hypothetical protein
LVRYGPIARRVADYAEGLIHSGTLARCQLSVNGQSDTGQRASQKRY